MVGRLAQTTVDDGSRVEMRTIHGSLVVLLMWDEVMPVSSRPGTQRKP